MIIFSIEVSNFVLEKFYQIQRRELHQEVLHSPFPKTLTSIVSFVNNLPIYIASHFRQISYQRHKFVFKYFEILESYLLSFLLRFAFPDIFLHPFEKCLFDTFSKILDKVEEEVKACLIYLFKVNLQIVYICLSELRFHKLHFMQPFASQITQPMQYGTSLS